MQALLAFWRISARLCQGGELIDAVPDAACGMLTCDTCIGALGIQLEQQCGLELELTVIASKMTLLMFCELTVGVRHPQSTRPISRLRLPRRCVDSSKEDRSPIARSVSRWFTCRTCIPSRICGAPAPVQEDTTPIRGEHFRERPALQRGAGGECMCLRGKKVPFLAIIRVKFWLLIAS